MARKSKYTPELIKEIANYIREGNTQEDSARMGGINVSTFYAYMKHKEFSEAIEKAHADFKKSQVLAIRAAGVRSVKGEVRGSWQANAWLLERKYPEEFGQRLTLKVSPEDYDLLRKMGFNGPTDAWQQLMDNARKEWADAHADS